MKITRSATSPANWISWVTIEHGAALVGQLAHDLQHLADQLGVERRGRLVEQDQLGLHRQHAGDRHALLLAAGQALGIFVDLVGEADLVEHRPRPLLGLRLGQAQHSARRHAHVVERGQVRKQVEALEDEADLGALPGQLAIAQMDDPPLTCCSPISVPST